MPVLYVGEKARQAGIAHKVLQILWGARGHHVPSGKLIMTQQCGKKRAQNVRACQRHKGWGSGCRAGEKGNTHRPHHLDIFAGKRRRGSCVRVFIGDAPVRTMCDGATFFFLKIEPQRWLSSRSAWVYSQKLWIYSETIAFFFLLASLSFHVKHTFPLKWNSLTQSISAHNLEISKRRRAAKISLRILCLLFLPPRLSHAGRWPSG